MRILSFDTSTSVLHLCLLEDRKHVYEVEVTPSSIERQEVASQLMPEIDKAVRQAGWKKRDIDLIVVGTGPGSFTGIRVAVITARTLAQVLQTPLIGVPLLESYFGAAGKEPSAAAVILSTTSGQFFYGAFKVASTDPAEAVMEPGFGKPESVSAALAGVPIWYGDEKACAAFNGERIRPLPFLKNIAAMQAQLSYDRLSLKELLPESNDGKLKLAETFPWREVVPLYLRSPSVTVKKNYATHNSPNERS